MLNPFTLYQCSWAESGLKVRPGDILTLTLDTTNVSLSLRDYVLCTDANIRSNVGVTFNMPSFLSSMFSFITVALGTTVVQPSPPSLMCVYDNQVTWM